MNGDCSHVKIVCLGEALIDLVSVEKGVSLAQARTFEKAPGGAPANVAVGLARLGVQSGFMGKVGDDEFGRFLASTLADNGVDISALLFSKETRTALAFVSLKQDGEREFMFYRHPSADMLIRPEEVDKDYIKGPRSSILPPSALSASLAVVRLWRPCAAPRSMACSYHMTPTYDFPSGPLLLKRDKG